MYSDAQVHQCVQTTGKKEVAARDECEEKGKSQPREVCYQLQLLPEHILLTAQQANKSRDELLGQGIVTLFGKPADKEDGGLVSQRTILPGFEC